MIEEVLKYPEEIKKYRGKIYKRFLIVAFMAYVLVQSLIFFPFKTFEYPYNKIIVANPVKVETEEIVKSVLIGPTGNEEGEKMYIQNVILEYDNHGIIEKISISNHEVGNPYELFKEGEKKLIWVYSEDGYNYKLNESVSIIPLILIIFIIEIILLISLIKIKKPVKIDPFSKEFLSTVSFDEISKLDELTFYKVFGYMRVNLIDFYRNGNEKDLTAVFGEDRKYIEHFVDELEKEHKNRYEKEKAKAEKSENSIDGIEISSREF